jgi:hypothetical protein
MLRILFTEFDRACFDNNVYKLYTIGDCYVAMGVTDIRERNPSEEALRVVELAFVMLQIIIRVRNLINF